MVDVTPRNTLLAFVALIACNLIFGLYVTVVASDLSPRDASVVYKVGLQGMSPIILSFYRQLGATPILVAVSAGVDRSMPEKMDYGWFMLIGLFGVFLNQTMYTYAVYYAGAALASILQLTNTPTTAAMAIIVGLEKFTWYKGAGLAGAVTGAAVMVIGGKATDAAANRTLGIVISLVQAIFISFWIVIAKKYLYIKYSPTTVAAGMHVTGLPWIVMVAFSVFGFAGSAGWDNFKLDTTGIWVVVFAIFCHSAIAYLCVTYANANLDASICATFGTLNPLFGTICGVMILGESVGVADIIGGLCILAGLCCVVYQRYLDSKMTKAIDIEALPPPSLPDSADELAPAAVEAIEADPNVRLDEDATEENTIELDEFPLRSDTATPSSQTELMQSS